ncbi:uncharacterized protein METZ01_LOCUS101173, partial [marine metagenome]
MKYLGRDTTDKLVQVPFLKEFLVS